MDTMFKEEILPRVPIEKLMRCKEVSRQWWNRIIETDFIYKHVDNSRERFIRLDESLHFINPTKDEVKSLAYPDFFVEGAHYKFIHCDSLLLVHFDIKSTEENKLYLWNPYKKQRRQIFPMDFFSAIDHYGIGYHRNTRRDYKVLRFYDGRSEEEEEEGKDKKYYQVHVEMFDTKSQSWKKLDAMMDWMVEPECHGLAVNGNMYWLAKTWSGSGTEPAVFVQCFDFTKETFVPICSVDRANDVTSLSAYRRNRLSVLRQDIITRHIEVLVTNPLSDESVSWSRQFSVANPSLPLLRPMYDFALPSHFINKENVLVVLYREEDADKADGDNDDELEDARIRICKIAKDGVHTQVDMVRGALWEPLMCGYVYISSQVPVPNLSQVPWKAAKSTNQS